MRRIEDFFRSNKKGFDTLKASPDIWEAISRDMDEGVPVRTSKRYFWLKWAAALAIVCSLSLFLYLNNQKPHANSAQIVGIDEGNYFPDISLRNPNGQLMPISSLKGKVVLVEFWASYSKVCTNDHCYFFKPLYEEFRDKGFEIYAVSVDSSAVKWVDAIEEDQLDWVQVSDLQGDESHLIEKFKIDKLPTTFLLNEEGQIIGKDIDVERLKDKLNQLLAYNK